VGAGLSVAGRLRTQDSRLEAPLPKGEQGLRRRSEPQREVLRALPDLCKQGEGQHIWDEDGNRYTDYWMGHMALILGHSPKVVVDALREQIANGTHYGMGSGLSVELGEEIRKTVPCAEMMRFCNTGAEATMYLVRLARGYTGKKTVIKMAGGVARLQHRAEHWVHQPFDRSESAGILPEEQAFVKTVKFNDLEAAEREVKATGGDVAAIFLEPVLGRAGACLRTGTI